MFKLRNAEELIYEVLEMNSLERKIYELCFKERTVMEIAEICNKSRSLVQRSLQNLLRRGVVVREGRVNKTVYYVYKAAPKEILKDNVKNVLESWYEKAKKMLS